jgi:recombination protein RecA
LGIKDLKDLLNKKIGAVVAHDLTEENPTEVKDWIPTGSRWLDSIICKGRVAGIPVGKWTEIAGLEATGKSYMAAQIAANAQKKGIQVVYFDSESSIDPAFLMAAGCNLGELLYIQATTVELVLETMETVLGQTEDRVLFIWDSLAMTPAKADLEKDFNPQATMAMKPRVLAKGTEKLSLPVADKQATVLILNQLKTNITSNIAEAMTTPYFTPGGKAMAYVYSLRIWLTGSKSKKNFITDDNGFRLGKLLKCKLEKSRFGTEGRSCEFKIMFGTEKPGILDEESWLEAIKISDRVKTGAWYSLLYRDGTERKFRAADWLQELEDPLFRQEVLSVMDEVVVKKFDERTGNAGDYYDDDGQEEETDD